jgi:hypothetical protein
MIRRIAGIHDAKSKSGPSCSRFRWSRKLRWARPGVGKRGGLRVIYYVRYERNEFWMLAVYAKAKVDNVPAHILKQLLEAFRDE